MEKNNDIIRDNEIDTEIIPALVRKKIKSGMSTELSVKNTLDQITGTASVALSFSDINKFILASNNGSLYLLTNNKDIIFASDKLILDSLDRKLNLKEKLVLLRFHRLKLTVYFQSPCMIFNLKLVHLKILIKKNFH